MLKSIGIAAAAALLGPTIGVAVFLATDTDHLISEATPLTMAGQEPGSMTELSQTDVFRSFVPHGLELKLVSIGVQERKLQPATTQALTEPLAWLTVITCANDQPVLKNGRCPAPKFVPIPTADKKTVADEPPITDSFASASAQIPERAASSPLAGRMSLGRR